MESNAATRRSSRRRPLHTCGVSGLEITHIAYKKCQEFKGPLGSMTRKIASLALSVSPLLCAITHQLLQILSFTDDHILALEDKVESIFPPSKHVFNKVDELLKITEILPGKIDQVVHKLPAIVKRVSFIDLALAYVISWLNCLICLLTHWRGKTAKDKEIMTDKDCNGCHDRSGSADEAKQPEEASLGINGIERKENFPRTVESFGVETNPDVTRGTYKEAVEKGKEGNITEKENDVKNKTEEGDIEKAGEGEKSIASESDESKAEDDPILELFESGWPTYAVK